MFRGSLPEKGWEKMKYHSQRTLPTPGFPPKQMKKELAFKLYFSDQNQKKVDKKLALWIRVGQNSDRSMRNAQRLG
jgi:hypothetical protein